MKREYDFSKGTQGKFFRPNASHNVPVHPITITNRDNIAGFVLSPERMEGIMETLEILANPASMKEIRRARAGRGKYFTLADIDES